MYPSQIFDYVNNLLYLEEQITRYGCSCEHRYYPNPYLGLAYMKCTRCGKIITQNEFIEFFNSKECTVDENPQLTKPIRKDRFDYVVPDHGNTGWICPVCGAGNSPLNKTCPCSTFTKIN